MNAVLEQELKDLPVQLVFGEEIRRLTGYTIRWLYTLEQRGEFPKRIHLGARRVAWDAREVAKWQRARMENVE